MESKGSKSYMWGPQGVGFHVGDSKLLTKVREIVGNVSNVSIFFVSTARNRDMYSTFE